MNVGIFSSRLNLQVQKIGGNILEKFEIRAESNKCLK